MVDDQNFSTVYRYVVYPSVVIVRVLSQVL